MTYVVTQDVEPAVITCSLLSQGLHTLPLLLGSVHEVVFGDKVRSTWMKTSSKEGRHDEVDERSPTEKVDEEEIRKEDCCDVDTVPDGRFLSSNEPWS